MNYLEFYKKNAGGAYEKLAFQYIINDLLRDNKRGSEKSITVGGMNMEETTPTQFVPSMFYVFLYVGGGKESVKDTTFYDMVPVILCTSVSSESVTGINFNFLPNDVRAALLDILTGNFEDYYEDDHDEGFEVNEKLGAVLTNKKSLSDLFTISKKILGIDISKCIRQYDRKRIFRPRMIENDTLEYITFLSFRDSVRGINLAKFQMELLNRK